MVYGHFKNSVRPVVLEIKTRAGTHLSQTVSMQKEKKQTKRDKKQDKRETKKRDKTASRTSDEISRIFSIKAICI